MTVKEAIKNALEDYIIRGADTQYDAERKVEIAREYLEQVYATDTVTEDWIRSRAAIFSRVIRVRISSLNREIAGAFPNQDVSKAREEKRVLLTAKTLVADFLELPL